MDTAAAPNLGRKRSHEPQAGPSNAPCPDVAHLNESVKRPRLTPDGEDAHLPNTPNPVDERYHVSDAALLYHTAISAHKLSQQHLQQAYIPSWVKTQADRSFDAVPLYAAQSDSPGAAILAHDTDAAKKTLALQLLALDLLSIGLKRPDLSDSERAAFTIEFVVIGMKVREALRHATKKGKERDTGIKVAEDRLTEDMQKALASGVSACERNSQLVPARKQLEWLNVKLILMENRTHAAKRIARQYLAQCQQHDPAHRYALYFLLLDKAASTDCGEALSLIVEIQTIAVARNHRHILQILALARSRLLFAYRRWDAIPSSLEELAKLLNWSEDSCTSSRLSTEPAPWHSSLTAHYIILRSLWEGRIGHDGKARVLLKRLYILMDESAESGSMEQFRMTGGIVEVKIDEQFLYLQTTPPNDLYILTFLATVTTRRDFIGPAPTCKTLIHIKAMREFELKARKDDMWDAGFGSQHGLADVWQSQEGVILRMAEIRLEEATAMLFRSDFVAAAQLLDEFAIFAQTHEILDHLGPHLCLVHAMMAQLLGHYTAATRYYQAAKALLADGSELGLLIEASLLGAQGLLQGAKDDHKRQSQVKDIAAKCKRTSSMALNTIGQLLAAMADDNLMSAKKKIGGAYDLCQQSNNNLLRALIFAFTSTTHLTGSEERVQKQLETGLDIATLLGGKDRPDQVGQPLLGLWFAVRLKKLHHRTQDHLAFNIARSKVQRYQLRLNEVVEYGNQRYASLPKA